MKKSRIIAVLMTVILIASSMFVYVSHADSSSYLTIEFDKLNAKVGEVIVASVKVNNISGFAGAQVNLKFDPNVLQPVNPNTGVAYKDSTRPTVGDVIINDDYTPLAMSSNRVADGILAFSRLYADLGSYKDSGEEESTGTLAIIGFKVLKEVSTNVCSKTQIPCRCCLRNTGV
jgi:hypothetical protein